jgi:hypothetical protein
MIIKRTMPHGKVSAAGIQDSATRDAVMRLSENVASLAAQLSELQGVCQILERNVKAISAKVSTLEG